MMGNFNELKEQGLDFQAILQSFESKTKSSKEDSIFDEKEETKEQKVIRKKVYI